MVTRMFEEEFAIDGAAITAGQNVIKASLFNLIIVSTTPHTAVRCQEFVRIVSEKYPCRIIFVQVDETSHSDLFRIENTVQAVGTGQNRVCFDQTTIETSLGLLHKVPFLVLANIMPDLPVYLLLGQDPTQDEVILPQLQRYANRVIFDCESLGNPKAFAEKMLNLLEHTKCEFIDVNWARTKAWREVVIRVFHDKKNIDLLNQSKAIQISYSSSTLPGQPKMEIQALYFQAWLAAQLNWTLLSIEKEDGTLRFSYRFDHSPISISLLAKDSEAVEPGALFSLEVLTHNDSHFLISHERASNTVIVHSSNPERCEMPYTIFLNNYQRGTPLIHEIFYQPQSEHYRNMLHLLNHPAWAKS